MVHLYWGLKKFSNRACLLSYCFFWLQKKYVSKGFLDLFFYHLIIEVFWFVQQQIGIKKIHISVVDLCSSGQEGPFWSCFEGQWANDLPGEGSLSRTGDRRKLRHETWHIYFDGDDYWIFSNSTLWHQFVPVKIPNIDYFITMLLLITKLHF